MNTPIESIDTHSVELASPHQTGTVPARETVLFGAGCFWGIEAAFRKVKGVTDTRVGYSGGHTTSPTYEEVCGHDSGHAEVVQVEFDPAQITFDELLNVFLKMHDSGASHRTGPDAGGQYRSAIFFFTPAQEAVARSSRDKLQLSAGRPIGTEISPATTFHPAEEYHQRYHEKHAQRAYPLP